MSLIKADSAFSLTRYLQQVERIDTMPPSGRVIRSVGLLIESQGPRVGVGATCDVIGRDGAPSLTVQVVGFRDGVVLAVPLGDTVGVQPGDRIVARGRARDIGVGPQLLGRVIDALGQPLDGLGPVATVGTYPIHPPPLNPMERDPVCGTFVIRERAVTIGSGDRRVYFCSDVCRDKYRARIV